MKLLNHLGTWSFEELERDPFDLRARAKANSGQLAIHPDESHRLVSTLLLQGGEIPAILLGFESLPQARKYEFIQSETSWFFQTSGTSGEPKIVQQRLNTLLRKGLTRRDGIATWGFLTQATSMAGFQVCLEAVSRGDFLLAPNPAWPVLEKLDFLRDGGVTHLSLTPSQARQCLFSEAFRDLRLRQVTLGGEIADQRILDSLSMTFPWAKITHVYASTETGPIMAISDKKAGFPSESHFLESKRLLIAPDGEIGIRTENGNVLWTGDLVEKRGDRYFFLGRKNGLINVGGAKVHPERVEATLLEIDWVDECRVFGLRNSQLGQIVGAELVARNPPSDFRSEIRRELKSKLSRVEIPQVIELVEEIAQSSAGKKARSA